MDLYGLILDVRKDLRRSCKLKKKTQFETISFLLSPTQSLKNNNCSSKCRLTFYRYIQSIQSNNKCNDKTLQGDGTALNCDGTTVGKDDSQTGFIGTLQAGGTECQGSGIALNCNGTDGTFAR